MIATCLLIAHGLSHNALYAANAPVNNDKIKTTFTKIFEPTPQARMTVISLSAYKRPKVNKIAMNKQSGNISCAMVGMPKPSKEKTKSAGTWPFAADPSTRTSC